VGQGKSPQTKEGSVSGVNPVLTGTGSIEEHHHDRRFSLPQDFSFLSEFSSSAKQRAYLHDSPAQTLAGPPVFFGLTAWIDQHAINPKTYALSRRQCIMSWFFLKILHRHASGAQRVCTFLGEFATGLFKEKTSMCVPVPVRIVEDCMDELNTTPSPSLGWQAAVVHFVVFPELLCCSLLRKYLHKGVRRAETNIITSHNAGEPRTQLGIRVHGQDHLISNLATLPPFDTIRNQIKKTIVK
jgi:hypothetical protein